jgi:hypothetical protein
MTSQRTDGGAETLVLADAGAQCAHGPPDLADHAGEPFTQDLEAHRQLGRVTVSHQVVDEIAQ